MPRWLQALVALGFLLGLPIATFSLEWTWLSALGLAGWWILGVLWLRYMSRL